LEGLGFHSFSSLSVEYQSGAEQVIEEDLLCPRLKIRLGCPFSAVLDKPIEILSFFFGQGVSSITRGITEPSN